MRISVMQPYIFPYIGYYQLINAVDKFILYDDVSYMKNSFINRNNILCNGSIYRFSIPVCGASSNRLIKDLTYSTRISKILKTIEQSYSKETYFSEVFPMVESTLKNKDRKLASICKVSFEKIFAYLEIEKNIVYSSSIQYNRDLTAEEKLLDICRKVKSTTYINSIGGRDLYSKRNFSQRNVQLKFLKSNDIHYNQGQEKFIPNLSMIDILMRNPREQVIDLLAQYELI